nr:3-hydroxyacyl-CoA dehydrogenase family protein [Pararhodobacter sp.]
MQDNPFAWGFVANRIFDAAHKEALRVVEEGVATAEQVDRILKDSYRWPVGPLEMRSQSSFE